MKQAMPELSVVIASYNSRETIEACLRSLERQECAPFEVIVVDSGRDGAADVIAAEFPRVRLIKSEARRYPGDARNIAVRHATGSVVAFLDADCIADSNWAREILRAHQRAEPIIGGAISNANPESAVGWARYLCEFSQWMPVAKPGPMADIPTCCLSVKSWALEKFGPFLEGTYCSDTAFNWRAGAAGHIPLFDPAIRVSHVNPTSLRGFLAKQVMHGKAFARVRVKERGLSRSQTAALWLGSPALPPLLLWRIASRVGRNRGYLGAFIRALPLVLAGLVAWCWGEARGYRGCLWTRVPIAEVPEPMEHSA